MACGVFFMIRLALSDWPSHKSLRAECQKRLLAENQVSVYMIQCIGCLYYIRTNTSSTLYYFPFCRYMNSMAT